MNLTESHTKRQGSNRGLDEETKGKVRVGKEQNQGKGG